MKEAADLMAMNPVVGGIEIEEQFLRRCLSIRCDELLNKDAGHTDEAHAGDAVLQSAQRRGGSQGLIVPQAAFRSPVGGRRDG